jgi:hypothetical protein
LYKVRRRIESTAHKRRKPVAETLKTNINSTAPKDNHPRSLNNIGASPIFIENSKRRESGRRLECR